MTDPRSLARWCAASIAIALVGGANARTSVQPCSPSAALAWTTVVTDADRSRLRRWRETFLAALAKARASHAAEVAAAGALLDPDATRGDPRPPEGDYRCRMVKIAGQTPAVPDFVAYDAQPCRITRDGDLRLRVTRGAQRPHGRLFADERTRMVFLGTMMLGDEAKPIRYGVDEERDLAGTLERIGANRWRLVVPAPHWQSMLDVMEIVPAGA